MRISKIGRKARVKAATFHTGLPPRTFRIFLLFQFKKRIANSDGWTGTWTEGGFNIIANMRYGLKNGPLESMIIFSTNLPNHF